MLILTVGDVVGKPGLSCLERLLKPFASQSGVEFVIVNGENANGLGITPEQARAIFSAGADVVTLGNHAFNRREIGGFLEDSRYMIRPANMSPLLPGRGSTVCEGPRGLRVGVINLIGRCFMDFGPDNPFFAADRILKEIEADVVVVDFHAQATSEKLAMGYYLDGRVSAVFGTHTHVQTADERINPKGTGYISDIGMTGPVVSVLGVAPEQSVAFFRGELAGRFETAPGECALCGALFDIDEKTGLCRSVERVSVS